MFLTLGSLAAFANGCINNVPETVTLYDARVGMLTGSISSSRGPGLVLAALATVAKAVDVLVHVLLPTPPFKQEDSYVTVPPNTYIDEAGERRGGGGAGAI
jgi:hypothetical protein